MGITTKKQKLKFTQKPVGSVHFIFICGTVIHTREYHLAIKTNELLIGTTAWMILRASCWVRKTKGHTLYYSIATTICKWQYYRNEEQISDETVLCWLQCYTNSHMMKQNYTHALYPCQFLFQNCSYTDVSNHWKKLKTHVSMW